MPTKASLLWVNLLVLLSHSRAWNRAVATEAVSIRIGLASGHGYRTPVGGYSGDDEKGGALFAQADRAKMMVDSSPLQYG
jgi:hypothetical protein